MRFSSQVLALAGAIALALPALAQTQPSSPPPAATAPTAPVAGANSFTEGQARSRIEAAGYTNVTDLQKDDQGVWRGRAMRNGAETMVGLDFQGNVVTGSTPATR